MDSCFPSLSLTCSLPFRCFLWMSLWVSVGNYIRGDQQAASHKLTGLWFIPSLQNHPFHPLWYPRQTFGKPPSIIIIYISFPALIVGKMTADYPLSHEKHMNTKLCHILIWLWNLISDFWSTVITEDGQKTRFILCSFSIQSYICQIQCSKSSSMHRYCQDCVVEWFANSSLFTFQQ